jgi:hypothetical protein
MGPRTPFSKPPRALDLPRAFGTITLGLQGRFFSGNNPGVTDMTTPIVHIEAQLDQVYCPFTGQPVHADEGINSLETLVFVYYGNASEYAYVSEELLDTLGVDELALTPEDAAARLDWKSCFLLAVDGGWNGVNFYCFRAPHTMQDNA